jgi:hypothetical protein
MKRSVLLLNANPTGPSSVLECKDVQVTKMNADLGHLLNWCLREF